MLALLGLTTEGLLGALEDIFEREALLNLAPLFDAFEEGAGLIDAAAGVDEGRVEVDVRFDEGWADEQALGWKLGGIGRGGLAGVLDAVDLSGADEDVFGDGLGLVLEKERAAADEEGRSGHDACEV